MQAKIRRSIERFGVVENLVARPHPSQEGSFEVLSGNPDGKQLAVVDPAGTLSIHAKSGTSTVVARGVSAIDW